MFKGRRTIIAISAAGFLEAILYGFTFPFFTLALEERGLSATLIGLNATVGALAVVVVGPIVPSVILRLGYRKFSAACFAVSIAALSALLLTDNLVIWFGVRAILGFACGSLWIITEAWVNHVTPDRQRGRVVALYQMIYSIGFLSGPGLTFLVGFSGTQPIILLLVVSALGAVASLCAAKETGDVSKERVGIRWMVAWRARGLLIVALVCGLVETGLYTLLPIFGMAKGMDKPTAVTLLVAFSIGAITMAIPLGWAADRFNRRNLLTRAAIAATICLFLMIPLGGVPMPAWVLAFIAGGTIIGLYNLTLIVLGESYTGSELPVVAAGYSMAYAIGCAGGAAAGGISIDLFGPNGLPFLGGTLMLAYVLGCVFVKSAARRKPVSSAA